MVEVLSLCEAGDVGKTKVRYSVYLNNVQLRGYIAFLLARGLLECYGHPNSPKYKTTAKGKKFLQDFERVLEELETEDSD